MPQSAHLLVPLLSEKYAAADGIDWDSRRVPGLVKRNRSKTSGLVPSENGTRPKACPNSCSATPVMRDDEISVENLDEASSVVVSLAAIRPIALSCAFHTATCVEPANGSVLGRSVNVVSPGDACDVR